MIPIKVWYRQHTLGNFAIRWLYSNKHKFLTSVGYVEIQEDTFSCISQDYYRPYNRDDYVDPRYYISRLFDSRFAAYRDALRTSRAEKRVHEKTGKSLNDRLSLHERACGKCVYHVKSENNIGVYCHRFPKTEYVGSLHWCGEYKEGTNW